MASRSLAYFWNDKKKKNKKITCTDVRDQFHQPTNKFTNGIDIDGMD